MAWVPGLSTGEISRALLARCETRAHFGGVYSLDTLPQQEYTQRPALVVVNTAYQQSKGEHWVGIYLDTAGGLSYFDSYGLPPSGVHLMTFIHKNAINGVWDYNYTPLQSLNTAVCGKYVCLYLYYRVVGYSHKKFISLFTNHKKKDSDVTTNVLFKKIFGNVPKGGKCVGTRQWSYKYGG